MELTRKGFSYVVSIQPPETVIEHTRFNVLQYSDLPLNELIPTVMSDVFKETGENITKESVIRSLRWAEEQEYISAKTSGIIIEAKTTKPAIYGEEEPKSKIRVLWKDAQEDYYRRFGKRMEE